jgi:hypothetical protein
MQYEWPEPWRGAQCPGHPEGDWQPQLDWRSVIFALTFEMGFAAVKAMPMLRARARMVRNVVERMVEIELLGGN